MRPPIIPLLAFALLAAFPPGRAAAQEATDYYLDLEFVGGGGSASVNGFPLFTGGARGTGFSTWLTPYLKAGENEIVVHCRALPDKPNARFVFDVVAHPHTDGPRKDELKKILAGGKFEPHHIAWLSEIPENALKILAGKRREGGGFVFGDGSRDRRVEFGVRLPDPKLHVAGRPVALDYVGLTHGLAEVEIHFLQQNGPAHLAFGGLALPPGIGEVQLGLADLRSGIEWLDHTTFDTIWIAGVLPEAAGEVGEVAVTSLKIHSAETERSMTRTFTLPASAGWPWQSGANAPEALADPARRAALVERLREVHRIVGTRPPEEWLPLFELKTRTYATGMHRDLDALRKSQKAFFERLANTKGWALAPFSPERLQIFAVNDHVVRVRYPDSEGPLVSVPLMKPHAKRPDRFTIPLYLALVDGEWQIVL